MGAEGAKLDRARKRGKQRGGVGGLLVAYDAIIGFCDVVLGGLGPWWRCGFEVADVGGGEEAFVVDAFGGFDVVEPALVSCFDTGDPGRIRLVTVDRSVADVRLVWHGQECETFE